MQNKTQKRNEARKNAEAQKAKNKAARLAKNLGNIAPSKPGQKGKSSVPQAKRKSK